MKPWQVSNRAEASMRPAGLKGDQGRVGREPGLQLQISVGGVGVIVLGQCRRGDGRDHGEQTGGDGKTAHIENSPAPVRIGESDDRRCAIKRRGVLRIKPTKSDVPLQNAPV
jgi:hypothetical protein